MLVAFAGLCELLCRRADASQGAGRSAGRSVSASSQSASTGSRPPSPFRRRCRPGSAGSRWCCCRSTSPSIRRSRRGLAGASARATGCALLLALAGAWAITEWLRAGMFTGFAWNPAGATLVSTPLITLSALIGTYGLSILVVLLGGAIWLEFYRRWLPLVMILGATGLLWLLPASNVPATDDGDQAGPHRPAQYRPAGQMAAGLRRDRRATPRAIVGAAKPEAGPRLLFWPEAAVTDPLEDARTGEHQAFAEFERTRAAALLGPGDYLLTGGIALHSSDGRRVDGATNSIFVLGPGGKIVGRYDKAHLVPYGEYLPMRPLLSAIGLSRLAPGDVDFTPGPGPRTVDAAGLGQGRLPALLRDHLLRARWSTATTARLHLQPVERRLVRPLGPAAASRPGAAARRRGRPAGDPRDPDRDQRGDRRRGRSRAAAAVAHGRGDRRRPAAAVGRPTPVRAGSATSSRCCSASLADRRGIALGASRRYGATYKDFLISPIPA